MLIRVDPTSDCPIYQQIVTQVTYAVAAGTLTPGQPVPSVRELATRVLVNPNTVARAYRELQSADTLEQRRGVGLFVTNGAPGQCRRRRAEYVRQRVRDVLREAVDSDLTTDRIVQLVAEELESLARCRAKE